MTCSVITYYSTYSTKTATNIILPFSKQRPSRLNNREIFLLLTPVDTENTLHFNMSVNRKGIQIHLIRLLLNFIHNSWIKILYRQEKTFFLNVRMPFVIEVSYDPQHINFSFWQSSKVYSTAPFLDIYSLWGLCKLQSSTKVHGTNPDPRINVEVQTSWAR